MNDYYVYVYLDPRKKGIFTYGDLKFDYEPFYVGKGKGSRYLRHLKSKTNQIKVNKIKSIINDNYEPLIIKYKENLTNEESLELEIELIEKIGRYIRKSGPLTNFLKGGEDPVYYKHKKDYIESLYKPVIKYDLMGNVLEEYESVQDAGIKNDMHPQTISSICTSSIKIYKNKYIFLYKGVKFKQRKRIKIEYPVTRIDYKGNEIKYDSLTDASEKNNISLSSINAVCLGEGFQSNGYLWRYDKKHPNISDINMKIDDKYSKYLNILNMKIIYNENIYDNILHLAMVTANKISNLYSALMNENNGKIIFLNES